MFANGYHESLDEGTAFDGMPGYMTPEEIRAKKLADKEKLDAEKEQVRAQKADERKEKAKAERARQKRIDQREKVNSLSYDSLADMAGLEEDNNDLTRDELLAVLRSNMSDEEILKLHKKMFENLNEDVDESDDAGKALASYLDIPLEDLDYVGGDIYETQDTSYIVCNEDEAYKKAVDEIKMLVDDMGLDAFTPHFKD